MVDRTTQRDFLDLRPLLGIELAWTTAGVLRPQRFAVSTSAVERGLESTADLMHARVCQSTESRDEQRDRDAFHGVQVNGGAARDRVVAWLEDDFAGKPSNRRCAGRDECSPQSWDRRVT